MSTSTCKMCEWKSVEHIICCNNCGISCCISCNIDHKQSCQLLKVNKYYLCKIHDCQVDKYCCQCMQLICSKCLEDNHKEHNIVSMRDAWANIRNNIHGEINEMEDKTKCFGDECSIRKKEFASVIVVIKEEGNKLRTLIDQTVTTLISQVNANMQLTESKLKTNEIFVKNLKDRKNRLAGIKSESSQLISLSQYSNIMRELFAAEKQHLKSRTLPTAIDVQNIRIQFRTLILNYERSHVDKRQNEVNDGVDELTNAISNINLNETERNQHFSSDSELKRTGQSLAEETECLQKHNQHLKEQINEMTKNLALHHSEKTFMKSLMISLTECIGKADDMKNQSEYLSKLSRKQNPVKDEFLEQTKYVLNHVIKITNDLHIAEQKINDQSLAVAKWTNDQNQIYSNALNSIVELNTKLSSCEQKIISYQKKITELQTAYDGLSLQNTTLPQQVFDKRMEVHTLTKEDELKRTLKEKDTVIELLKKEKDDLQNRFSSIVGEKLKEGNPAITDLGDTNRPIKVGEKYGDLYDNEWTDAMACISTVKLLFPHLQQAEIEEVAVRHLCYILTCCYAECLILAQDQLQSIVHTMQLDVDEKSMDLSCLPVCKDVAYLRRQNCEKFSTYLFREKVLVAQISTADWDYSKKSEDLLRKLTETEFFQKCIQICWSMVIQNPAIHLDEGLPLGTAFDKTIYKEFTESGDKVKYVVWPALFLHKNGPLLYKGVVQACK